MNRIVKTTTAGAFLLIAVAGCGHRPAHEAPGAGASAEPASVQVIRPASTSAAVGLVLPGRVAAAEEITVTARVPARLTSLQVREGDPFRRGRRLVEFEAPETKQQLVSAKASLQAARVRREVAGRQLGRVDSLFARGIVARVHLDQAQAEMEAASAGLAQAEAALAGLEEGLAIPAPFDGVVVRRYVDVGARLNPGEPILGLRSAAAREVEVAVPESSLPTLDSGTVSLEMPGGRIIDAERTRLEGMTDYRTRTRVARFAPKGDGVVLEPGAFVRVRIGGSADPMSAAAGQAVDAAGESPRLYLPTSALVSRGALRGVYVIDNGVARLRWLRVGRENAGQVEVLAGLDAASAVAADPKDLSDGRPVRTAS